jgi:hypothetical protein
VALIGRERVIKKKTREIERKAYEVCPWPLIRDGFRRSRWPNQMKHKGKYVKRELEGYLYVPLKRAIFLQQSYQWRASWTAIRPKPGKGLHSMSVVRGFGSYRRLELDLHEIIDMLRIFRREKPEKKFPRFVLFWGNWH